MPPDSWLPVGFELPDGKVVRQRLHGGRDWQIFAVSGAGRALVATAELTENWVARLVPETVMEPFSFGERALACLTAGREHVLQPVSVAGPVQTTAEAMAFAVALKQSRALDPQAPLHDAIYVERFSRLLPTHGVTSTTPDEVLLGYWLTGGVSIPATAFRRLHQLVGWSDAQDLRKVVEAAGFEISVMVPGQGRRSPAAERKDSTLETPTPALTVENEGSAEKDREEAVFELPGRPDLVEFFNEHVVDVLQNRERYEAVGIGFPSPIVLHGPPGTGKTFAVERLVEFLGWPSYRIDASSVASPYIHDTSRKIAGVFDTAMDDAPSVLIIDEMDAFLASREGGTGQHRTEEVAEFLRRIPEASDSEVLVVAMTNRVDLIDNAVLRRGRFDHVIEVGYAQESEVEQLLESLIAELPTAGSIDVGALAASLSGRPLSDVAFVVREGARLAVRAGCDALDEETLLAALRETPARHEHDNEGRVGFV